MPKSDDWQNYGHGKSGFDLDCTTREKALDRESPHQLSRASFCLFNE